MRRRRSEFLSNWNIFIVHGDSIGLISGSLCRGRQQFSLKRWNIIFNIYNDPPSVLSLRCDSTLGETVSPRARKRQEDVTLRIFRRRAAPVNGRRVSRFCLQTVNKKKRTKIRITEERPLLHYHMIYECPSPSSLRGTARIRVLNR